VDDIRAAFRRLLYWSVTTFSELPDGLEGEFEAAAST
jgi:hypothetical protein